MDIVPGVKPGEDWGINSLSQALEDVHFPISRDDLVNQIGDRLVEVEEGKRVTIRELAATCTHDMYKSPDDFMNCPHVGEQMRAA